MKKYRYSEQEQKQIESNPVPYGVYQFIDNRVVTIAISEGFRQIIGVDTMEEAYDLMDNDMYKDTHPDDLAEITEAAIRFAEGKSDYDVVYRTKRGEDYYIIHAVGKHVVKEDGTRLAVVNYMNEGVYCEDNSDIALGFNLLHQKYFQSKDTISNISYDALTGLPEMNYFFELAEAWYKKAVEEGKNIVMMFMDMDGMKAYNQRYGYGEGDVLIKAVARILVKYFSGENCCRISADHFMVYTYSKGIDKILKKLVEELREINEGRTLPVRIGIYDSRLGVVGPATACDRAKIACDSCGEVYESKVVPFSKKMLKKFEDRRYVFENIDRAIAEGWIDVYYQPIIRTSNGKICNEEALVRWIDPKKGVIAPLEFIPFLEDAKIAYKLDLFVVEKVIEKHKRMADSGIYVVPNSVNLSRTDFYACDIVEEIRRRVDDSGIDRSRLIIELTESVVSDDIDFMMTQVNRFRSLGFNVWMDDFGSGYSSPEILQKIHFDVVKMDKAFVDRIEDNEGSRIILTEMIRLAAGLGSETVAEGVETSKQVEFLKEIGCTRLQGYYFSKAISTDEILIRKELETKIGFENPKESDYYAMIGNINLYDMSFAAGEDSDDNLQNYFDTMPMIIIEVGDEVRLSRGNKSYRDFMTRYYPNLYGRGVVAYDVVKDELGVDFINAIKQCKNDGKRVIVDVRTGNNDVVHLFFRKIATNPENGVVAMAIIILGYADNDAELRHKEALERLKQEQLTYARITALSGDFICIYSVDPNTEHYVEFNVSESFKTLGVAGEGDNFFEDSRRNGSKLLYIEDVDLYQKLFTRENVLSEIKKKGVFAFNYRLMMGGIPRYTTLKAAMVQEEDGPRLIVGIIDMDDQVKKDQEYSKQLIAARDIANLDALTGVKNKHAYVDAETKLDDLIDDGAAPEFAVVVCDLNGLKVINDTQGHQAGDQFIKDGCALICNTFHHSPVFRVGGDEFAVILRGEDYKNCDVLMNELEEQNQRNKKDNKVVVAAGMAKYHGDRSVAAVFERADIKMYNNKKALKQ